MRSLGTILILLTFSIALSAQSATGAMGVRLSAGTSPNTTLDVNGAASFREGTALNLTLATNNDVALADYSLFRITGATAAFSITGFASPYDGRVLTIINATSYNLSLTHQATSTAAYQINTGGSSITLLPNGVATLVYNLSLTKWVVTGTNGTASSGSSGWGLTGNASTTAGTNYLGTSDGVDMVFKTTATERMRILAAGNVGIGLTAPTQQLEITQSMQMPNTSSSSTGVLYKNGVRFMHNYGSFSTFLGANAGNFTQTGNYNIGIGDSSLYAVSSGTFNVAVGYNALKTNTTRIYNVAVGGYALENSNSFHNTAVGHAAARYLTSGGYNTAIGVGALSAATTNSYNTAIGYRGFNALRGGGFGTYNVGLGYDVGYNGTTTGLNAVTTGSNNTLIGSFSGFATDSTTQYDNSTALGYRAAIGASNAVILGSINGVNGSTTNTSIGMGVTAPTAKVHQDNGDATANYHKFTAGTTTGQTATDGFDVGIDATGNAVLSQKEALPMLLSTNATERMRILSTGEVGINQTVPSAKLHVENASNAVDHLRLAYNSSNYSTFRTSSLGILYITPKGPGGLFSNYTQHNGDFGVKGSAAIGYGTYVQPDTTFKLSVVGQHTNTNVTYYGIYTGVVAAVTTAATSAFGISSLVNLSGSVNNGSYRAFISSANNGSTGITDENTGGEFQTTLTAAGTTTVAYGVKTYLQNHSTGGTISNGYCYWAQPSQSGVSTITNTFGYYAATPLNTGGGTYTNVYGMYINTQNVGTNAYGLYIGGATTRALHINSGTSYFGGNVGIGFVTPVVKTHQDGGTGVATYHKFTAGTTTNQTVSDGFDVGIDATGNAIINQNEALPMIISTSATERVRVLSTGEVGVGTSTPTSTFQVNGSEAHKVLLITTGSNATTLGATHSVIIYSGTITANSFTLPTASTCTGREYRLINHSSTAVTSASTYITANGTTLTGVAIAASLHIISDGTNWHKIN